jgi:hypothetical protein
MVKKILKELHALAWTISGGVIVIITLSGQTRTYGLWLTVGAFVVHMFGIIIKKDDNEE